MKKLIIITALLLALVGCVPVQEKDTNTLLYEYDMFLQESLAEINIVQIMLPTWYKSTPNEKDLHLDMFYQSKDKLKQIGYNKETRLLYQYMTELNNKRLEIFDLIYQDATGSNQQSNLIIAQKEMELLLQKAQVEYVSVKKGVVRL